MTLVILFLIGLIIFDIIALWWGSDSRDGIDSVEWQRRRYLFL